MVESVVEKLRVFVSSTIKECAEERSVAKRAIHSLNHEPILFEHIGARSTPPRELYLNRLETSDTGKTCRVTLGKSKSPNVVPVKSYRQILNAYVNNPEAKFLGPGGNRCNLYTRGVLQRDHVIAGQHRYCGKEFKRKLEQGPVDHETDFKCKTYENGRIAADPETLRQLAGFSEREIANGTGLHRKPIRLFRHGGTVTRRTHQKIMKFLREQAGSAQ